MVLLTMYGVIVHGRKGNIFGFLVRIILVLYLVFGRVIVSILLLIKIVPIGPKLVLIIVGFLWELIKI